MQDASEALLLLLSSLEDELFYHYAPPSGSLMDVSASSCKISYPKSFREEKSECQRWQQGHFGQFDGIIGSILTCRSCSSQVQVIRENVTSLSLALSTYLFLSCPLYLFIISFLFLCL